MPCSRASQWCVREEEWISIPSSSLGLLIWVFCADVYHLTDVSISAWAERKHTGDTNVTRIIIFDKLPLGHSYLPLPDCSLILPPQITKSLPLLPFFPCPPFPVQLLPAAVLLLLLSLSFCLPVSGRAKPIPAQITVIKSLWGWGLRLRPLNTLVVEREKERGGGKRKRKRKRRWAGEWGQTEGGTVSVLSWPQQGD